ncbi:MAG: VWA domain-containing protein [Candidatus Electryoneaceae bacterium]|nr:VWA domain-containing protein [Candidatus Electryoneaceae bacterium]
MIKYVRPDLLYLLWVIPVLLIIVWWEHRWRLGAMRRWASESLWDTVLSSRAPGRILFKRILFILAIALLIVAVAGPQIGTRLVEVTREGTDIALVVDLSQSMLSEDIVPNRIKKARHEIGRFLDRLGGDRVALVPFAGVAFIQVPLTLDYGAVVSLLNVLEPGIIPQPGSSLSLAIERARKVFQFAADGANPTVQAQRIIVLITDGGDDPDDIDSAIEAARLAAEEGIIIYTIGMATPSGGPIPIKGSRGRVSGYKTDSQNNIIVSRLNESLLVQIASLTGGEFFRASRTGDEFRGLHDRIMVMDKTEFEAKQFTDYEDRFQWFAGLALFLVVLGEFIPSTRRRKRG